MKFRFGGANPADMTNYFDKEFQIMSTRIAVILISVGLIGAISSSVTAQTSAIPSAVINSGTGLIVGINDLVVSGTKYNVTFHEGSFDNVYDVAHPVSPPLTFSSAASADAAVGSASRAEKRSAFFMI